MNRISTFLAAVMFVALAGCATVVPVGGLYTNVEGPVAATSNPSGTREGEACSTVILSLFAFGDASVDTARRNGAISMISTVDMRHSGVPFLFLKSCTIVRGR